MSFFILINKEPLLKQKIADDAALPDFLYKEVSAFFDFSRSEEGKTVACLNLGMRKKRKKKKRTRRSEGRTSRLRRSVEHSYLFTMILHLDMH